MRAIWLRVGQGSTTRIFVFATDDLSGGVTIVSS